ncbi:MAG TPA: DinB family protein [Candidatus Sulfotelmatobacter sp.]|nr:DinB family protein [Candidatus Sulfotelmatobacter sp.]
MIAINPEQAAFLLQYMLPAVKNEQRTTRAVIEAIPQSGADYRPDPNSRTALELAWHMVAAEHRFYSAVVNGEFDLTPIHRPDSVKTPAQIGEWYGTSFEENFAKFPNLSGEQLAKILDFRGIIQSPAVTWLNFSLNHIIHHRGQLSAYLRAMGGRVPAIYGESYDSAAAKAAQAQA